MRNKAYDLFQYFYVFKLHNCSIVGQLTEQLRAKKKKLFAENDVHFIHTQYTRIMYEIHICIAINDLAFSRFAYFNLFYRRASNTMFWML